MDYFRGPLARTPDRYVGHYVLARERDLIPRGWRVLEQEGWMLGTSGLRVVDVRSRSGDTLGWCIGDPFVEDSEMGAPIRLAETDTSGGAPRILDDFYERTWGRYALILLAGDRPELFLDPHGSLGAVYTTTRRIVASTPTFMPADHEWNDGLIDALGFPERDQWFPSGLTAKKGVRRLLPNHCLDLDAWTVRRHWPGDSSHLEIDPDVSGTVRATTAAMRGAITRLAARHPVQCTLTAGRDTRVLLACARGALERMTFFTHAEGRRSADARTAERLAREFGLTHVTIPIEAASADERRDWLFVTGHSVSGTIWRIHRGLRRLDRASVLLHGMGGEVARGLYWEANDRPDTPLSARDLARRAELPEHPEIVVAFEGWLSGLASFDTLAILDLFYLEQTLGCWAAPQHFGNEFSLFDFSPFNHRRVIAAMMRFAADYKRRQQFASDACLAEWPELSKIPFNEGDESAEPGTGGVKSWARALVRAVGFK